MRQFRDITPSPSYRKPIMRNKASIVVQKMVLESNPNHSPEAIKTQVSSTLQ